MSENDFDEKAPLSKIGIGAMILGLLGATLGAAGLVSGLFDFSNSRLLLLDIGFLALGCVLMWVATEIACSKIAYKDMSGRK
jgi:hypothetical protein